MKSIIFLLAVFVAICYARCDCDAADNSCISKCGKVPIKVTRNNPANIFISRGSK